MACLKALVLIFTTLLLAVGLSLSGFIIWLMVKASDYDAVTGSKTLDIGFIVFAVFICLVSIVGCWGACAERPTLLNLFVIFLVILLTFKLASIALWFTQKEKIESFMRTNWNIVSDASRIGLQEKLSCCSMKEITVIYPSTVDPSCYQNGNVTAGIRKRDCFTGLMSWLSENKLNIMGPVTAVMVVEVIIMILVYLTLCVRFEDSRTKTRTLKINRVYPSADQYATRRLAGGVQLKKMDFSINDDHKRDWARNSHR